MKIYTNFDLKQKKKFFRDRVYVKVSTGGRWLVYYDELPISCRDIIHYDFDFMGFHSDGPDILRIRIERDDGTYTSMTPVKIHRGQIGYLMVVIDGRLHQRTF